MAPGVLRHAQRQDRLALQRVAHDHELRDLRVGLGQRADLIGDAAGLAVGLVDRVAVGLALLLLLQARRNALRAQRLGLRRGEHHGHPSGAGRRQLRLVQIDAGRCQLVDLRLGDLHAVGLVMLRRCGRSRRQARTDHERADHGAHGCHSHSPPQMGSKNVGQRSAPKLPGQWSFR